MAIPTINDADAYHTARANTAWAALGEDETAKTAALYRADDYIRARYRFVSDVEADDPLIAEATIALAAEMTVPLSLKQGAPVKRTKESVVSGLVAEEVEYFAANTDPYPQITDLLAPIRKSSAFGVIKLVR